MRVQGASLHLNYGDHGNRVADQKHTLYHERNSKNQQGLIRLLRSFIIQAILLCQRPLLIHKLLTASMYRGLWLRILQRRLASSLLIRHTRSILPISLRVTYLREETIHQLPTMPRKDLVFHLPRVIHRTRATYRLHHMLQHHLLMLVSMDMRHLYMHIPGNHQRQNATRIYWLWGLLLSLVQSWFYLLDWAR